MMNVDGSNKHKISSSSWFSEDDNPKWTSDNCWITYYSRKLHERVVIDFQGIDYGPLGFDFLTGSDTRRLWPSVHEGAPSVLKIAVYFHVQK